MITIGVDPGSKVTAIAVLENTRVLYIGAIKPLKGVSNVAARFPVAIRQLEIPSGAMRPAERIAVEGQKYRRGPGPKATPDDLIQLAQISGLFIAYTALAWKCRRIAVPQPHQWSAVPKAIRHNRIKARLDNPEAVAAPFIKDKFDAVGLALWAQEARESFFSQT